MNGCIGKANLAVCAAMLALAGIAGAAAGVCMGGEDASREGTGSAAPKPAVPVRDSDWILRQWMQSPVGSVDICRGYWGAMLPGVEDVFQLTKEQKDALQNLRTEYEREKDAAIRALREKYEVRVSDILSASQRRDREALDAIGREYRERASARAAERAARQKEMWEQVRQGAPVNMAQFSKQAAEEDRTLRTEFQEKMKAAVSPETKARLEALLKETPSGAAKAEEISVPPGKHAIRMNVGGGGIMVIQGGAQQEGGNGKASATVRIEAGAAPGPGGKDADPAEKKEKAGGDRAGE
ncbi:MAG: hypothetical protein N3A38_15115 [Planctomycetota bacterium]|nr:hypothetical protein [Planctomycetota bacterium]